jgi:hypothetical protein
MSHRDLVLDAIGDAQRILAECVALGSDIMNRMVATSSVFLGVAVASLSDTP